MSGKGCVCADEEPKDKRKRKVMSVRESEDVSCIRLGESALLQSDVIYGVNESTFHLITKR